MTFQKRLNILKERLHESLNDLFRIFFIEKPINRNEIVIRKVIVSSHKLRCAFFFFVA